MLSGAGGDSCTRGERPWGAEGGRARRGYVGFSRSSRGWKSWGDSPSPGSAHTGGQQGEGRGGTASRMAAGTGKGGAQAGAAAVIKATQVLTSPQTSSQCSPGSPRLPAGVRLGECVPSSHTPLGRAGLVPGGPGGGGVLGGTQMLTEAGRELRRGPPRGSGGSLGQRLEDRIHFLGHSRQRKLELVLGRGSWQGESGGGLALGSKKGLVRRELGVLGRCSCRSSQAVGTRGGGGGTRYLGVHEAGPLVADMLEGGRNVNLLHS